MQELETLIRARYPVIYVVSWEEERVERCLREIAETWRRTSTCGPSPRASSSRVPNRNRRSKAGGGNTADPLAALDAVIEHVQPAIYLFKDFPPLHGGRSAAI